MFKPLMTATVLTITLFIGWPCSPAAADDFDGDGVEDTLDVCCNTPPGVPVDAEGRPVGDIDQDCDVDLADFLLFQDSFTGPMECTPEVCDGMDNDCNCLVDDMGILSCGIGACYREVEVCVDGVLQDCVPGDPVPEACDNALDDDCDGVTDCEDADDCPVGTPCDDPGLHLACTESETCECAEFWDDCDGDPETGCETYVRVDEDNCGECDYTCYYAHAVPECDDGECRLDECLAGWGDCDGFESSGCETELDDYIPPCTGIISLGVVCGDEGCLSGPEVSGHGGQWFEINVLDCDTSPFSGDYIYFDVYLDVPYDLDYDLYLYTPCDELIASSTEGPGRREYIGVRWTDGVLDDSKTIFLEVRYFDANRCDDWSLETEGGCEWTE